MTTRSTKKDVAVKETLPAYLQDQGETGNENVGVDDIAIPRLGLVQSLSPQRKKNDPAFIPGAEEGMLFNTVTGELYGTEMDFIPVFFRKEWVLWKTRDAGGGLEGFFPTELEGRKALARMGNQDQYELTETAQNFVLLLTEDGPIEAVILMSKSKLKVSRKLNSLIRLAGGPRWSKVYHLESIEDSSQKGDYYNFKVTPTRYVTQEEADWSFALYEAVKQGQRDMDRNFDEPTTEGTSAYDGSSDDID